MDPRKEMERMIYDPYLFEDDRQAAMDRDRRDRRRMDWFYGIAMTVYIGVPVLVFLVVPQPSLLGVFEWLAWASLPFLAGLWFITRRLP